MSSKSRFRQPTLRRKATAPQRHTALSFEGLETRQMMTATPTATLNSLGTQISSVASAVSGLIVGDRYENDNTAARAMRISTDGTSQEHSIHAGADVDWVKFTLTERSNVVIETSGSSGDTRMWLYGPNSSNRQVDFNDDGGTGTFSRIERIGSNSLAAGTYYVKVDEYGNNDVIPSYTIRVTASPVGPASDQYEDDNTASRATTIRIDGTAQTHSIHTGADVDWVRFTLTEQSNVVVETGGATGDTRMWLYGPNSSTRQIDYNDDAGTNAFSRIERSGSNSLAPGTYYVKVDEYGNNDTIGNYTIRVQATAESPPVTIMPIVSGDDYANEFQGAYQLSLDTAGRASASGSIARSGDVDVFRFVARGNGQTTIDQNAFQNSGLDTYLYVYDSQGREIARNDDYGGTRNSHVTFSATAGAAYYVKAAAFNSGTGAYQLVISGQPVSSPPPVVINPPITPVVPTQPTDDSGNSLQDATTLVLGTDGNATTNGVIERSGDVDMFRFIASATGQMTVDQIASNGSRLDTYLVVFDGHGQEMARNDDSGGTLNSHVEINVSAGETYFVKAGAFGSRTGGYQLRIFGPPPRRDVSPLWNWIDRAAAVVPGTQGRRPLLFGEVTIGLQEGSLELASVGLRFMIDVGDMAGRGADARDGYANVYVTMPVDGIGISVSLMDLLELSTPGFGYDFGVVYASTLNGTPSTDAHFQPTFEFFSAQVDTLSTSIAAIDVGGSSSGPNAHIDPSVSLGTIGASAYLMRSETPLWQGEVRRDVIDAAMTAAVTAANPAGVFLSTLFGSDDLSRLAESLANNRQLPISRPFTPTT